MISHQDLGNGPLAECVAGLALIDHHVHGALTSAVSRDRYESMLTEAPRAPQGTSVLRDAQVGLAIRRWCAPLLDLDPHADGEEYWARRNELGEKAVAQRLLSATGVSSYLVETGHQGDEVTSPQELASWAGTSAREVVRLETVAESLLATCATAASFYADFPAVLGEACENAVGTKSILAYRHGFDVPPERPGRDEVMRAAAPLVQSDDTPRVADPQLLRWLQWCAVDLGLPLQLHCGYGDPDLDLHRANPLLLMPWLRLVEPTGVAVMLLHNYPFHREAGYLAQVFENVYLDVGLAINYTGAQSRQVIAEGLELAPFNKLLYSSDAWGPAELHLLGSILWRRGMAHVVGQWVLDGDWSQHDAERIVTQIGSDNATRVYEL